MDLKNIREPIAFKKMFIYYFILIPNGVLFILTTILFILGKLDEELSVSLGILIASGVGWSPFLILFVFKYKKPKILISKDQDVFIIHGITKDISIPMNIITKISYWYNSGLGIIYIKTNTKFLRCKIQDVRNADQVSFKMNSILDDYKVKNNQIE